LEIIDANYYFKVNDSPLKLTHIQFPMRNHESQYTRVLHCKSYSTGRF